VAQDAVNQGAAVILTSEAEADRLGIAAERRVYLHGYADAHDAMPSERGDLSRSVAMEATLKLALASSGLTTANIAHFDLYSCFPVAVLLAAEALGIDWQADPDGAAKLTVTGGLPFFGGAGNNYSMHAIATMVERLRADPDRFGLVLANGGFLSKEAVGVYSARPPAHWQPVSSAGIQADIDALPAPRLLSEDCTGHVESYSVVYAKGVPTRGYAFIRTSDGARALARCAKDEAARFAAWVCEREPLGRELAVRWVDGVNLIDL
jgi:acetyl-CoA C-acetyltransferase